MAIKKVLWGLTLLTTWVSCSAVSQDDGEIKSKFCYFGYDVTPEQPAPCYFEIGLGIETDTKLFILPEIEFESMSPSLYIPFFGNKADKQKLGYYLSDKRSVIIHDFFKMNALLSTSYDDDSNTTDFYDLRYGLIGTFRGPSKTADAFNPYIIGDPDERVVNFYAGLNFGYTNELRETVADGEIGGGYLGAMLGGYWKGRVFKNKKQELLDLSLGYRDYGNDDDEWDVLFDYTKVLQDASSGSGSDIGVSVFYQSKQDNEDESYKEIMFHYARYIPAASGVGLWAWRISAGGVAGPNFDGFDLATRFGVSYVWGKSDKVKFTGRSSRYRTRGRRYHPL